MAALLSLAAVAWHAGVAAGGRRDALLQLQERQELFNWQQFSAQQGELVRKADGLAAQLGGSGRGRMPRAVQKKGAAIKQALANLMHGLAHDEHDAPRPTHKYIPMDQELAILKVQKQMRGEHRFGSDRIEGGGDVAAVVNEQEQADERNALMEDPTTGPDTKTKHLFENCEDGSLTAEDAELCGRRASAIKMITRRAIQEQLDKNPPVRPDDTRGLVDAERENAARKDLIAYALIGKQYVALMDEEKKADAATAAQRKALLAQGRGGKQNSEHSELSTSITNSKHRKRESQAAKRLGPRAPRAKVRKAHAKVAGGQAQGRSTEEGTAAAKAARRADGDRHGAGVWPIPATVPSPTLKRPATTKKPVGDLGPLQDLADSMPKHLSSPKGDSKTRLADLESAISSTQARLAKEKMRFTKEMLRRQKQLQAEFLDSMQQIHAGLSVVDDVGVSGDGSRPSSKSMLAAEQAAFMQRQRDGVIAEAATAEASTRPAVTQQMNPVVAEVEREIAASKIFRHPPKPLVSTHRSAEDEEKATVRAALDEQFAQVASDGRVAPKVRHDKWTDLMSKMSEALSLQPATAAPGAGAPGGSKAGRGGVQAAPDAATRLGGASVRAGLDASGQSKGAEKHERRRQELRLLSSYGYKEGLHRGHVGPASYRALAAAASADIKAVESHDAPTLKAAAATALARHRVAQSPQVFTEQENVRGSE
jgi:hypothetical protein